LENAPRPSAVMISAALFTAVDGVEHLLMSEAVVVRESLE
jgi:hypothetical protein